MNNKKNIYYSGNGGTSQQLQDYNDAVDTYNNKVTAVRNLRNTYESDFDAYQQNLNLKLAIDEIRGNVHNDQQTWQANYDAYPAQVQSDTADSFYDRSNTYF